MHVCMPESRRLGQVKSWQAERLTLLCCGANPHELRYQTRLRWHRDRHNPKAKAPLLLYHSPGTPLDT